MTSKVVNEVEYWMIAVGSYYRSVKNIPSARDLKNVQRTHILPILQLMWAGISVLIYVICSLNILILIVRDQENTGSRFRNDKFNEIGSTLESFLWLILYPLVLICFLGRRSRLTLVFEEARTLLSVATLPNRRVKTTKMMFTLHVFTYAITTADLIWHLISLFNGGAGFTLHLLLFVFTWIHSTVLDIAMVRVVWMFTGVIRITMKKVMAEAESQMKIVRNYSKENALSTAHSNNNFPRFDLEFVPALSEPIKVRTLDKSITCYGSSRSDSSLLLCPKQPAGLFETVSRKLAAEMMHIDEYYEVIADILGLPCMIWMLYNAISLALAAYFALDSSIERQPEYPLHIAMFISRLTFMIMMANLAEDVAITVSF